MAGVDEPTLGEVLRGIESLRSQVAQLVVEIKEDRQTAAQTYVRQDVYDEVRRADARTIAEVLADAEAARQSTDERFAALEKERRADQAARRQLWLALAGLTITLLLGVAGLIVSIVQG